jgi:hypothetical protein
MQFTRRQFFKVGLAGAVALVAIRAAYGPFIQDEAGTDSRFAFLRPGERTMLAAIAAVILAGALPPPVDARKSAIDTLMLDLDRALAGLNPSTQEEVRELFSLLNFAPARWLIAGVHKRWSEAGADDITAFLQDWRLSRWQLLQSAYHALHELMFAAWYAQPAAWPAIGYPGPPALAAATSTLPPQ